MHGKLRSHNDRLNSALIPYQHKMREWFSVAVYESVQSAVLRLSLFAPKYGVGYEAR